MTNTLTLGTSGTLTLNGGTVSAGALITGTPSQLIWTSGTLNITGSAGLTLDSVGTAPLGSTLTLAEQSVARDQWWNPDRGKQWHWFAYPIGDQQRYCRRCGSGGVNSLVIGNQSAAIGSYALNNAAATLIVNGSESIGEASTGTSAGGTITQYGGTFNQSNGGHTVTGTLFLGDSLHGTGLFNLSGGSLSVGNAPCLDGNIMEVIGASGTGNFIQSGGVHSVGTTGTTYGLVIGGGFSGFNAGFGAYSINNANATLIVNGGEFVGFSAPGTGSGGSVTRYGGTFNQSVGTHTVTRGLILGYMPGATGNVHSLRWDSGCRHNRYGVIQAMSTIGDSGIGAFTQSGGTHTIGTASVSQNLYLGYVPGSSGTYTINNANAVLNENGETFLGGSDTAGLPEVSEF